METFARLTPNKLGQPGKLTFGKPALAALGWAFGERVHAELNGETLTLTAAGTGERVIRSYNRGHGGPDMAPYISLGTLLADLGEQEPLGRHPLNAVAGSGVLTVHLRHALTDDEYRWRRWQTYSRADRLMQGEPGRVDRGESHSNVILPVPVGLLTALVTEAEAMKLTLPSYIVHLLAGMDRRAVTPPVADTWRAAGWQVRNALKLGSPLTAAEMIARGIPPASDEAWLRARVGEGLSYQEMARQFGGAHSVYSKWGRRFGLKPDRLALARKARRG